MIYNAVRPTEVGKAHCLLHIIWRYIYYINIHKIIIQCGTRASDISVMRKRRNGNVRPSELRVDDSVLNEMLVGVGAASQHQWRKTWRKKLK
jgi:hypothetical protein